MRPELAALPERVDPVAEAIHEHLHVRVLCMKVIRAEPARWRYRGVVSPFWRLYHHRDPGGEVRAGGRVYPLVPGRGLLVPAWVRFDCLTRAPVEHLFIHFDLVGLTRAALAVAKLDSPQDVAAGDGSPLGATLNGLSEACRSGRPPDAAGLMLAKAAINLALSQVFAKAGGTSALEIAPCAAAGPRRAVGPALRLLDRDHARRIPNPELAAACGYAEHHFIRLFRTATGQTPARHQLERRVATAAELLAFGNRPIDEVAQRCGFDNRFHFSRAFKGVLGIPPAAYRAARHV